MTYSPRTLHTKLAALREDFGFTPEYITNNPSLIGYSTERRVRPRVQRLRELLGAFQEGRSLAKPSAAARPLHDTDTTVGLGEPRRLGPQLSSGREQPAHGTNGAGVSEEAAGRNILATGSLARAGPGRGANQGKVPDSGVPGITEDAVVMAYMLAMSDEKFELVLERFQRRSNERRGTRPARKRPGMKT